MKNFISIDKAVGKTIAGTYYDGSAVLVSFSDDTFAYIKADSEEYEGYPVVTISESPDLLGLNRDNVVKLSIATLEELQSLRAEQLAKAREEQEATQRRLYCQLRKKYGDIPEEPSNLPLPGDYRGREHQLH